MNNITTLDPSAKTRGDAAFDLAARHFLADRPVEAYDAIKHAIAYRRMFYGAKSKEVKEGLELARKIQTAIVEKNPSLATRKRRKRVEGQLV